MKCFLFDQADAQIYLHFASKWICEATWTYAVENAQEMEGE